MVSNDCNDRHALECGLVPNVLGVFFSNQKECAHAEEDDRAVRCLALRILASLSSSQVFDSVFSSSSIFQVQSFCSVSLCYSLLQMLI
jgi:hypothetical protein